MARLKNNVTGRGGPTHEAGNPLDLVFTNLLDAVKVGVGHKITDHAIVDVKFQLPVPKKSEVARRVHGYKKADWVKLQDSIAMEMWAELDSGRTHDAVESFIERLEDLVDMAIPHRTILERKGTHPWISGKVLELVEERNAAIGTPDETRAVMKCSEGMLEARRSYEARLRNELLEMRTGCKEWWKKSRELTNRRASAAAIPALRASENAEWCLAPKDKADLFAATFTQKCILREKESSEPDRRRAHFFHTKTATPRKRGRSAKQNWHCQLNHV